METLFTVMVTVSLGAEGKKFLRDVCMFLGVVVSKHQWSASIVFLTLSTFRHRVSP